MTALELLEYLQELQRSGVSLDTNLYLDCDGWVCVSDADVLNNRIILSWWAGCDDPTTTNTPAQGE